MTAVWILTGAGVPHVHAQPISELIVFGDSHSDVGNWVGEGRFSESTNWVDELALQLDLPFTQPSREGGSNYAMGGARTGTGADVASGTSIPQVGTQVTAFLKDNVPRNDQLFVVLVGHNDFGWGEAPSTADPLNRLSDHISALSDAGARNFVVSNVPPLAELPAYLGTSREDSLRELIPAFNQELSVVLDDLEANSNADIFRVDFYGMVNEMIRDSADFGLVDVQSRADSVSGANPDEYLHWDANHYTSATYGELGKRAATTLPGDFKSAFLPLIPANSTWRFFPGREEPSPFPELAWASAEFEDDNWLEGREGFGFGTPSDIEDVETVLEDMRGQYSSVFTRHEFSVDNIEQLQSLRLFIDYDDLFVAFINGVEVARSDFGVAGEAVAHDAQIAGLRGREAGFRDVVDIDLAEFPGLISPTDNNVLAIQGLNVRPTDRDFVLANLRLDGILTTAVPEPNSRALVWLVLFGIVARQRRQHCLPATYQIRSS